ASRPPFWVPWPPWPGCGGSPSGPAADRAEVGVTVGEAFFRAEGSALVPSAEARSPWSDQMLHGRLLAALAARVAEGPASGGLVPVRLTCDLFRAAPIEPVTVETDVLRDGRRVRSLAVRMD